MKSVKLFLIFGFIFLCCNNIICYDLPYLNLGVTNILDGGPIRPRPGWYLFETIQSYFSNNFLDQNGNKLTELTDPHFYGWYLLNGIAYQSKANNLFGGHLGIMAELPISLPSGINHNALGITDSGTGFGDLTLGIYTQWDPIFFHDRPFFVDRLEFNVTFPSGKYKGDGSVINPGNNIFFIELYWAATLYMTQKFTASWRIYYLWCFENHANNRRGGNAIHFNYSLDYEVINNLHIGINGYFLQQLTDSTLCNIKVPDTKERVFGVGPGACYFISADNIIFGYFYVESLAINRSKGLNAVASYVHHF